MSTPVPSEEETKTENEKPKSQGRGARDEEAEIEYWGGGIVKGGTNRMISRESEDMWEGALTSLWAMSKINHTSDKWA